MKKRLQDIGEFGLIQKISQKVRISASVVKSIGDDCAVLKYTKQKYLLFTTDMIIEDIHFRKKYTRPEDIGHKALAVNISDIASCGGLPKWAVISVGVSAKSSFNYIMKIYKGIEALAARFKVDIVGGDTNLSEKIVLSVALVGEVEKKNLILRSKAGSKDAIVLSGPLKAKPDDLTFMPRLEEARYLVKNFGVTSMIDISDGFLQDLNHILKASGKGAIIYESLFPYKERKNSLSKVLNKGEQFELIFTMPSSQLNRLPKPYYPVGEIREGTQGLVYVNRDGLKRTIKSEGYRHF